MLGRQTAKPPCEMCTVQSPAALPGASSEGDTGLGGGLPVTLHFC